MKFTIKIIKILLNSTSIKKYKQIRNEDIQAHVLESPQSVWNGTLFHSNSYVFFYSSIIQKSQFFCFHFDLSFFNPVHSYLLTNLDMTAHQLKTYQDLNRVHWPACFKINCLKISCLKYPLNISNSKEDVQIYCKSAISYLSVRPYQDCRLFFDSQRICFVVNLFSLL